MIRDDAMGGGGDKRVAFAVDDVGWCNHGGEELGTSDEG